MRLTRCAASACCAVCCHSQGLQGGPHNHTISALAVALKQANTAEFKQYQQQVVANCQALSNRMQQLGYTIVSGAAAASASSSSGLFVSRMGACLCVAGCCSPLVGRGRDLWDVHVTKQQLPLSSTFNALLVMI
jgi:hypothetical protein